MTVDELYSKRCDLLIVEGSLWYLICPSDILLLQLFHQTAKRSDFRVLVPVNQHHEPSGPCTATHHHP